MKQRRSNRPLAAFTLMEVMVAVGALAVLAVAVATVFEVTGRTVTGGRRLSAINSYANLIESQMRQDFAAISRDGVMVMRHQYAEVTGNTPTAIPAHPDDASPRARRADEIVFFVEGQFTSAREPIHPELIPSADSARVYYGHGQKGRINYRPTTQNNPEAYWQPELRDLNYDVDARLGRNVPGNPNYYAADWTLLRHVTLLIPRGDHVTRFGLPPQKSQPQLSNTALFQNASADQRLWDSSVQVAAQPAAFSIFRRLNQIFPNTPHLTVRRTTNVSPRFASGLVDIAACSLHEVRAIVTASEVWPNSINTAFFDQFSDGYTFMRHGPGTAPQRLEITQAWMEQVFPSENPEWLNNDRRRLRYESLPPNLVGAASRNWPGGDIEAAYRRADQAMLASWGFLPHCTEFIVEWSFGHTFPASTTPTHPHYVAGREGELIWYGIEREDDSEFLVRAFGADGAVTGPRNWSRGNEQPLVLHGTDLTIDLAERSRGELPLYSYFGYFDPTHNPTAAQPTRPWSWPRFVRITLSLADPRDPDTEHTFQFVFDIPQH